MNDLSISANTFTVDQWGDVIDSGPFFERFRAFADERAKMTPKDHFKEAVESFYRASRCHPCANEGDLELIGKFDKRLAELLRAEAKAVQAVVDYIDRRDEDFQR